MKATIFFIHLILISFVCIITYYNSIDNEFTFDDHNAIEQNGDANLDNSYANIWMHDIWGRHLTSVESHKSYRPLLITVYRMLIYYYGVKAQVFRIFSIFAHIIATICIYYLTFIITDNSIVSFGTSILFASHPVHVESVVAVVNMAEALSCIFYVLSYVFFIKYLNTCITPIISQYLIGKEPLFKSNLILDSLSLFINWLFWIIFVIISVLFKETGITICGMIIAKIGIDLVHLLSYQGTSYNNSKIKTIGNIISNWFINYINWIIIGFSTLLMYIFFRMVLVNDNLSELIHDIITLNYNSLKIISQKSYLGDSELIRKAENPFAFLEHKEKIFSLFYLHFRYFYILLWPSTLCAEYAFDCIPKVSNINDFRNLYSIGLYLSLIFLIIIGIFKITKFCKHRRIQRENIEKQIDEFIKKVEVFYDNDKYKNKIDVKENEDNDSDDEIVEESETDVLGDEEEIENLPLVEVIRLKLNNSNFYEKNVDKDNEIWDIRDESLIVSLTWLIIPFIPASGFFLRLGTLLAERLLYVPSIGFCMLLSIGIYYFSINLIYYLSSKSFLYKGLLSKIIYSIIICLITMAYIAKTRSQNMVWENDETLFLKSIQICPNSAKLQLQVAKLWLNKGHFQVAKGHLERSRAIDPDFCDVGYQYALLEVFHNNNINRAIEIASDNLNCIFTAKQSLELIHSLWKKQIEYIPKDSLKLSQVLNTQGDIASKSKPPIYSISYQKYNEAANAAYELNAFDKSIKYLIKSEKSISKLLDTNDTLEMIYFDNERKFDEFDSATVTTLICRSLFSGGKLRVNIKDNLNKSKSKKDLTNKEYIELDKGENMLIMASHPRCINYLDSQNTDQLSSMFSVTNVAWLSYHTIYEKYSKGYQLVINEQNNNETRILIENFAKIQDAGIILFKEIKNKILKFSGSNNNSINEINLKLKELFSTSSYLWSIVGRRYHEINDYNASILSFDNSLRYEESITCLAQYWRAQMTAGLAGDNFLKDKQSIKTVMGYLKQSFECHNQIFSIGLQNQGDINKVGLQVKRDAEKLYKKLLAHKIE